jgi:DNA-binding MarR family transcriptional regulator
MVASTELTCSEQEGREIYGLFRAAGHESLIALRRFSEPPYDLSLTDVRALLYLTRHLVGVGSIGELAKGLNSSLGWASRVADALARDGLVACIRDRQDRRLVHLTLTQKGAQTAHLLSANLQKAIAAALSEVPSKQRKVIGRFLQRFTESVNGEAAD